MPQCLKAGDVHAKLFAGVHVIDGDGQGGFHQAHRFGTQTRGAHIHGQLQGGQAIGADALCCGVFQLQLAQAAAVLRLVGVAGDGARAAWHQKQSQLSVHAGRNQEAMGLVTGGHQAFGATEVPGVTHLLGGGLGGVQVVTRTLFMVGQHQQSLATGQARQPFGFHVVRRVGLQHRGADPSVGQGFKHHAAPELFHHHHALHRPHVHAAVGVLHIQTAQAQLGQGLVGTGGKTT